MSKGNRLYFIVKKIHLYTSLATVALLLMYLITSYMMMYHDWFKPHADQEPVRTVAITPADISAANWPSFLKKHSIKGRLIREQFKDSGELFREYGGAGSNFKLNISKDKNRVEIKAARSNLSGKIIGRHRLRGYGGPLQYNIYALLLDAVGLGLIVFAITGVILWLKLLKYNTIAWAILILGFIYVSAVLGYLLFV